jgi:hypothetical protein
MPRETDFFHGLLGVHRRIFDKVKSEYAVGDPARSRLLSARDIAHLAPQFMSTLGGILGNDGARPIDLISRYGRKLSDTQTEMFLHWLDGRDRGLR